MASLVQATSQAGFTLRRQVGRPVDVQARQQKRARFRKM